MGLLTPCHSGSSMLSPEVPLHGCVDAPTSGHWARTLQAARLWVDGQQTKLSFREGEGSLQEPENAASVLRRGAWHFRGLQQRKKPSDSPPSPPSPGDAL